ncbi:putative mucin TcMUCII [Trypanosoma cruzi]|nr:putative mucin TcMUCII [Trypanosoma cruzi]
MMTCHLLCALLMLALCCCPSVCVGASGGKLSDPGEHPNPQKDVSETNGNPKGTQGIQDLTTKMPKDQVENDAKSKQGPPSAPQGQPVDENRLGLEIPELNAAGSTNTPGSKTPEKHAGLSEDASGLQGITNPKNTLSISPGTATTGQTPVPPAPPEAISLASDNPESSDLAKQSAQTQVKTGQSELPSLGSAAEAGDNARDGQSLTGAEPQSSDANNTVQTESKRTTKPQSPTSPSADQTDRNAEDHAQTTTTTTAPEAPSNTAMTTEAPTTTTTRAPSHLREIDGSLSSSAWVCTPLLLAASALTYTTVG